jgi:hypothetical protein
MLEEKYKIMSTNTKPLMIEFSEVRHKIIEAIENTSKDILNINESVTLLDGFVNSVYTTKLSNDPAFGGPFVPMVMLVGNVTGRIYFFSYKKLVKE